MKPAPARTSKAQRLALGVTAALALGIASLSLAPLPDAGPPGSDKALHILAYAALALPLSTTRAWPAVWVVCGAVAYGGMIELVQPLAGRTADWIDLLADAAGAAIGAGTGWCLRWGTQRILARGRPT